MTTETMTVNFGVTQIECIIEQMDDVQAALH